MVQQPEKLIEVMDVSVTAAEMQYLQTMTELDNIEVKAESMELALVLGLELEVGLPIPMN